LQQYPVGYGAASIAFFIFVVNSAPDPAGLADIYFVSILTT